MATRPLRALVAAYVEFFRNIPLLLIIYFVYFGLPLIGISVLDNLWSFIFALVIYSGAYLTEIFRAGIQAIGKGYIEAGKAIGLKPVQVIRYVTMPLMFRIVLPSLGNTFISLFKDTSLAAAISVAELTYGAMRINVNTLRVIEVYTVVGLMYLRRVTFCSPCCAVWNAVLRWSAEIRSAAWRRLSPVGRSSYKDC